MWYLHLKMGRAVKGVTVKQRRLFCTGVSIFSAAVNGVNRQA